jgi:hypothetical protein
MTHSVKRQRLPLHEEVMLLALSNYSGKIDGQASFYPQIVAGAMIAELVLSQYISIEGEKNYVKLNTATNSLNNTVLIEALSQISSDPKQRTISYWMGKFARMTSLKKKVAHSLIEKGILDKMEFKQFWLFTATHYPEKNPNYEIKLVNRLEQAIFSDIEEIDVRTATLIALLHKTRILSIPFDANALNKRKQRMQSIAEGNLVGNATSQVIQQIQTALMVMSVMPAVTSVITV